MRDVSDTLLVESALLNSKRRRKPSEKRQWAKAEKFLRGRGFRCEVSDTSEAEHMWTGEPVLRAPDGAVLIHEYAHFCVCAKNRVLKPGFGLGSEPYPTAWPTEPDEDKEKWLVWLRRSRRLDSELTDAGSNREESRASLLGILIERWLGMNWAHTLDDHNWTCEASWAEGVEDPDRVLAWLHKRRLIYRDGDPALLPSYSDRTNRRGAF